MHTDIMLYNDTVQGLGNHLNSLNM